jgi:hypothetical protein
VQVSVIVPALADATPIIAAVSTLTGSIIAAASALAGSLIGGGIAAGVSVKEARDNRRAAESSWVRDSRRAIYDRFLVAGQSLLHELQTAKRTADAADKRHATIDAAYSTFVGTYASVQTVAEVDVVQHAREQMYLLEALKSILDDRKWFESDQFDRIAEFVRFARQDTIDAMRADLDLDASAKPKTDKEEYEEAVRAAVEDIASKHPRRDAAP